MTIHRGLHGAPAGRALRRFAEASFRRGCMPSVKQSGVVLDRVFPREAAGGREGVLNSGLPRSRSADEGCDSTTVCTQEVLGRLEGFSLIPVEEERVPSASAVPMISNAVYPGDPDA